jgi:hypothetical protein
MPAGEGNLFIGAEVDKGAIDAGLTDVQAITRKAAEGIAISFQECSTKTAAAMRNISQDVKAAAESVSQESVRVAQATRMQAEAMADVRRAAVAMRDDEVDAALAAKLMAAAQDKAAAAAREKAAAVKASAEASARAAEEEELSANWIVRSWQIAARGVSEACGEMQERMVQVAETGKLTGESVTAGFGAIGKLLGAGIIVQFATNFLDETAKVNIELSHLSEKTGITIESLSGLQQIVREMGGEFEPISAGLVRLARAQQLVIESNPAMTKAFERIGISVEQVRTAKPEELLQLIATRFQAIHEPGERAASAIALFGKGGAALIPVLMQEGDLLTENIQKTAQMTGVTEESVEASERWTRNMAIFSAEFHKFGNFAIENMHYVVGAFDAIGAGIQTVLELIAASSISVVTGMGAVGKLMLDIASFSWASVAEDAKKVPEAFTGAWRGAFKDIGDAWKETASHFRAPLPEPKHAPAAGDDTDSDGAGGGGRSGGSSREHVSHARAGRDKKADDGELARLEQQALRGQEEMSKALQKQGEDVFRTGERWDSYNRAVTEGSVSEQRLANALDENDIRFRESIGALTPLAAAQQLAALHTREHRIEIELLEQELRKLKDEGAHLKPGDDGYEQNITRQQHVQNQIGQQKGSGKVQGQQDRQAIDQAVAQPYLRAFDHINQGWLRVQNDLIAGNKNIARDFAEMGTQLVQSLAQNFEKMIAKDIERELRSVLIHRAGNQAKVTDDIVSASQSSAIARESALKQIFMDAKQSAAGAYKAVVGIPIIGPVLAPVAAATAFAGVMALESFNEGGVVSGNGGYHVPILAKQGERILTGEQNSKFEQMVGRAPAAPAAASGMGSPIHVHYAPTVHAQDRTGMRATLRLHSDDIVGIVRQAHKQGKLLA